MSAWFYTYFDYLALLYLLWVMIRSWRYGPYLEGYNILSAIIMLGFFRGIGLFSSFWRSLDYLLSDWMHLSRFLAMLLALLFSLYLLWKIRKAMSGLLEIRPVPSGEDRVQEALKHGFEKILLPAKNRPRKAPKGIEVIPVQRLSEALSVILEPA